MGFAIAITTQLGATGLGGEGVVGGSTYHHMLLALMWLA